MSARSIFPRPPQTRNIVRFPARHTSCVWVLREDTAWLVLAGSHGWLHGDDYAARVDAQWLAHNLGLPIRSAAEIIYRLPNKECEMSDDRKFDNSGILFKSDKSKDTDRDYRGNATIDGREYWMSAWIKEGKKGKFMTFSFKPKDAPKEQRTAPAEEHSDEIPF